MIDSKLHIVPVSLIPKGSDCTFEDLPKLYKLGLIMESICEREKGLGLSAVQIGIAWRFYLINYSHMPHKKDDYRFFINCNYKKNGDEEFGGLEGCLSLKKEDDSVRYFLVKRPKNICISGKELFIEHGEIKIKDIAFECDGVEAVVHMHEIDHGFGILISDIGVEYGIWR